MKKVRPQWPDLVGFQRFFRPDPGFAGAEPRRRQIFSSSTVKWRRMEASKVMR